MSQHEILVVDDDRSLLETVKAHLGRERFAVHTATSVQEAMDRLRRLPYPDAMILDISLEPEPADPETTPARGTNETPPMGGIGGAIPDDGLGLLRWLRRETDFPVIMLSSTNAESVKVLALNLGADDYVTKPFGAHELAARVRAVLRRVTPAAEDVLHAGRLEIDPSRHTVLTSGEPVRLTHAEFGILHSLAQARGRVLTRGQLLDAVFGSERLVSERTIDVHVRRLRKKLEADPGAPEMVLTVRGAGYRLNSAGD